MSSDFGTSYYASQSDFEKSPVHSQGIPIESDETNNMEQYVSGSSNSRGGWRTMPFIIGNEICERMGSLSVLWNLVPYLNSKYHMNYVRAVYIVNAVSGTCSLTPLAGAYLADSYFGRHRTIIASSLFTLTGLILLVISAFSKGLQPIACNPPSPALIYECPQASTAQISFLLVAFGFIAIGSGGLRSSAYAFGADQFDGSTPENKRARQKFFNWFYFGTCVSLVFALTVIVYIQSSISWGLGYLILTIAMMVSIFLFVGGSHFYRHAPIDGSAYAGIAYVLVAAFRKRRLKLPSDPTGLYQIDSKDEVLTLKHTDQNRFLDKAAILSASDLEEVDGKGRNRWRICTVHEVEECKSVLNLLPIWACMTLWAMVQTQVGTFTIGQAIYMNTKLGKRWEFPPASLFVVTILTFIVAIPVYDQVVLRMGRRITKNPRGVSLLTRVGMGVVMIVVTMIVAGHVENMRTYALHTHGKMLSVFWLIPQCALLGIAETLGAIGQFEMYYEELPQGMRSLSGAMYWSSAAFGSYLADLVVSLVQQQTTRIGTNWLPSDINFGHLDRFYYLQAFMSTIIFLLFLVCAHRYKYVHQS